jgi:NAD(P)H-hydrate epimerase
MTPEAAPAAIVAGRGNNGGDGFVVARHLHLRGYPVEIHIVGEPDAFRGPGDAGVNFIIAERLGLPIHPIAAPEQLERGLASVSVVVDGLLGTGLTGEVRGLVGECIDVLNGSGAAVYALDVPSGLDCDTGEPLGRALRAAATATFAAMKPGLAQGRADEWTGPVDVVDIGAPVVWE